MRQKPVIDTNRYCIRAFSNSSYLHTSYGDYDNTVLNWTVELEKAELFDRESALQWIAQLPPRSVYGVAVGRGLKEDVLNPL